jgi:proteasome lid subunit RPN8/RPN11
MTWTPSPDVLDAALKHAERQQPSESCGVVVDGRYVEIANRATEVDAFAMDRAQYLAACKSGTLEAVVHSHVYSAPIASMGDLAACERTGVPWLILNWPVGTYNVIEPSGYIAPLIGRTWSFGTLDCWGMVRDGFHAFTGIWVPDFPRTWEWWKDGRSNLIVENVEAAGFVNLGQDVEPRHCDVIVMQVRADVPNHCALYIEPEGLILHHLQGHLSVRETYGGVFQKLTRFVARYKAFLDEMPPAHDPNDRTVWTGEKRGNEPS